MKCIVHKWSIWETIVQIIDGKAVAVREERHCQRCPVKEVRDL